MRKQAQSRKPAKTKLPPNRFHIAHISCPRCAALVSVEEFIVNYGVNGVPAVFLTTTCPVCSDIVQVGMNLTSATSAQR